MTYRIIPAAIEANLPNLSANAETREFAALSEAFAWCASNRKTGAVLMVDEDAGPRADAALSFEDAARIVA